MKTLLIPYQSHGLGNKLVFFAHVIAFAEANGLEVMNPGLSDFAKCFHGTETNPLCRYPAPARPAPRPLSLASIVPRICGRTCKTLSRMGVLRGSVLDMGYDHRLVAENLSRLRTSVARSPGRFVLVCGWSFRDVANVARFAPKIREYFALSTRHADKVNAIVTRARADCDVLVGVHMRRGDYQRFKEGRFFYPVAVYEDLIRKMRSLFPIERRVSFVTSSDDAAALRTLMDRCPDLHLCPAPGEAIEDMYTLAACDYIVGPPSTFSKWASFYGHTPLYPVADPHSDFALDDFEIFSALQARRAPRTQMDDSRMAVSV